MLSTCADHRGMPTTSRRGNQHVIRREGRGGAHATRRELGGRNAAGRSPHSSLDVIDLAGLRVTLRPIRADDEAKHDEFLARVDPRDLRFRFGREIDEVPRRELARMTQVDCERERAFVATIPRARHGSEIIGEVRARADVDGGRSEFAIIVRSDFQRQGLGRVLLEKLIHDCWKRNVRLLYGLVASSNTGMLGLARALGFEVDHVPDSGTVVVSLDLQSARDSPPGDTALNRK